MVYGIHENVKLWSYVNKTSLWINMTESWNCAATFSESLLYRILRNVLNLDTRSQINEQIRPLCKVAFFLIYVVVLYVRKFCVNVKCLYQDFAGFICFEPS
jgi:hypothetical protein